MKKGFTLIELLAVILILGIIALIAIPTVNKILNEAREGAFRTSSDNIMKSMEQACQTSLIRGESPVLNYIFTDGKSSSKLEVKGTMPDDGYVFLDNECSVTDYFLKDQNYTYTNGEDIRQDYMLKAPTEENTSILKTLYPSYYDNIVTINFINNITVPEEAIEVKDPSVSGRGKIKSWLVEDSGKYNLYVGSEKLIYANYNSSSLFFQIFSLTNINFENFDTTFVNDMSYMFSNLTNLSNADVSSFNTSNVTSMNSLFEGCQKLENINVTNWYTRNLIDMRYIFLECSALTSLDLSNWDTSKVEKMHYAFCLATNLREIKGIENWDTSNATSFEGMFNGTKITSFDGSKWKTDINTSIRVMFVNCTSLTTLNLSGWNLNNIKDSYYMLYGCNSLNKIIITDSDINSINLIISALPNKTSSNPGTIIINDISNTSNIDTSTANSKYWNIA